MWEWLKEQIINLTNQYGNFIDWWEERSTDLEDAIRHALRDVFNWANERTGGLLDWIFEKGKDAIEYLKDMVELAIEWSKEHGGYIIAGCIILAVAIASGFGLAALGISTMLAFAGAVVVAAVGSGGLAMGRYINRSRLEAAERLTTNHMQQQIETEEKDVQTQKENKVLVKENETLKKENDQKDQLIERLQSLADSRKQAQVAAVVQTATVQSTVNAAERTQLRQRFGVRPQPAASSNSTSSSTSSLASSSSSRTTPVSAPQPKLEPHSSQSKDKDPEPLPPPGWDHPIIEEAVEVEPMPPLPSLIGNPSTHFQIPSDSNIFPEKPAPEKDGPTI